MHIENVKEVIRRLGELADKNGIGALNCHERAVLVSYWAFGIIGNGGFKYYYEGASNLQDAADQMRRLGLLEAATACECFLETAFPEGHEPIQREDRLRSLSAVDWDKAWEIESGIYRTSYETVLEAIRVYVEQHRDSFAR